MGKIILRVAYIVVIIYGVVLFYISTTETNFTKLMNDTVVTTEDIDSIRILDSNNNDIPSSELGMASISEGLIYTRFTRQIGKRKLDSNSYVIKLLVNGETYEFKVDEVYFQFDGNYYKPKVSIYEEIERMIEIESKK
jgi:urease alpha subunit